MTSCGVISLKRDGGWSEPHSTRLQLLSRGKMSTLFKIVVIVLDCKLKLHLHGIDCALFIFLPILWIFEFSAVSSLLDTIWELELIRNKQLSVLLIWKCEITLVVSLSIVQLNLETENYQNFWYVSGSIQLENTVSRLLQMLFHRLGHKFLLSKVKSLH